MKTRVYATPAVKGLPATVTVCDGYIIPSQITRNPCQYPSIGPVHPSKTKSKSRVFWDSLYQGYLHRDKSHYSNIGDKYEKKSDPLGKIKRIYPENITLVT